MINDILLRHLEENKEREIYFWGASKFLKNFLSNHDLRKYNIRGIYDSNYMCWGEDFSCYKILKPEKFSQDAKIIITIKNDYYKAYGAIFDLLKSKDCAQCLLGNIFLEYERDVKNNKLYLIDNLGNKKLINYLPGLNIVWYGENSSIEIGCEPVPNFHGADMQIWSNSTIKVGASDFQILGLKILSGDDTEIIIGRNFSSRAGSMLYTLGEKNKKIIIGDDCMFSRDIVVRTTDSHSIVDKSNKKVINYGSDVEIGNHVWITQRAMVLKGSKIPDGCVIGANSLVNKKLKERDSIYAGSPAKLIRRNIEWKREQIDTYLQ